VAAARCLVLGGYLAVPPAQAGRALRPRAHRRAPVVLDGRRGRRPPPRQRARCLPGGAARAGAEPMSTPEPFRLIGCVELRQTLDHRATDERELLDRLEDVPAGSIFYHTHGYFLRHRP